MTTQQKILFISSMGGSPWGGSEELWAQAASVLLLRHFSVHVCMKKWLQQSNRLDQLSREGASVSYWKESAGCLAQLISRLRTTNDYSRLIRRIDPDIIVSSNGGTVPGIRLARCLIDSGKPYVTVCQANNSELFFSDEMAELYIRYFQRASANAFVAQANLDLLEAQLGARIPAAVVVRNPAGASLRNATLPVPLRLSDGGARFACVARLHPPSKGQDLLLAALSSPKWKARAWTLDFYGEGPQLRTLQRLSTLYGLEQRVAFCGHSTDISSVWQDHDVLLLPSRYEGTPLVLIEAMLCGRPAVATAVGDTAAVIDDSVTGFLAGAPTIVHLDAALERLWLAKESWPSMGRAAHDKIKLWLAGDPGEALADLITQFLSKSEVRSRR